VEPVVVVVVAAAAAAVVVVVDVRPVAVVEAVDRNEMEPVGHTGWEVVWALAN
jgi:inorganic pyrophosphatase